MKKWVLVLSIIGLTSFAWGEAIRVACIGNSITVYHGNYPTLLDMDSYPAQLRILLGEGYDVQNFGVSGRTLLKKGDFPIWTESAFAGALAFQPNIVTIMLGTNDSKPQNWVFKDEFIADYEAMIDTLRSLDSHPEIYVCLPAPAFSSKFDISGPIIADEMIPMIQQVIQEKNTHFIDFHTPFVDKSYLFYDGIHPTLDGLWEFTKLFYAALDSNAKTIEVIQDQNLALNKTVVASVLSKTGFATIFVGQPGNLVDGEVATSYACSDGESVVIDLGSAESTDMVQIILTESAHFGYQIETGDGLGNWTTAVDSSTAHKTTRVAIASIAPVQTRYLRFTFFCLDDALQTLQVAEIRALQTAPAHAPVITSFQTKVTNRTAYYDITITSCFKGGYLKYYYDDTPDSLFGNGIGYRYEDEFLLKQTILKGKEKYFFAKFYNNGYEVASDTIKIDYPVENSVDSEKSLHPDQFMLHQNFPNPFNPSTMIRYDLPTSTNVKMIVYDCLGREVKVLVNQFQQNGSYSVRFDLHTLSAGPYFYRLVVDGFETTRKMLLIK